jgi:hypothetical protein
VIDVLLTKEVEMKWRRDNKETYENKGYKFTNYGEFFIIKIEDLSSGSQKKVKVKCDDENCEHPHKEVFWFAYLKQIRKNGKYYCKDCTRKNIAYFLLKNGNKSFYDWCIENNKQDILDRWDYNLNKYNPNEICYNTNTKYWFKCNKNVTHKSELKLINSIIYQKGSIKCKQCNSFAQFLIDKYGGNALELFWDFKLNKINPWNLSRNSKNIVWIKCQEVDYHESYQIKCNDFYCGQRCVYCSLVNSKVHPLDSLGALYPKSLVVWSDKNKKSPFEYNIKSNQKVWWKCPEEKHQDYFRSINSSNTLNFRCPECQYSQGEDKISNYLINKDFIKIMQEEYDKLLNEEKYNIKYHIPQKTFNGLIGIGGGLLSYDFYLPNYNLLIEYQGMQHEKYCRGFHKSKKTFEKQIEHDKRKKEYALLNNINLLEIWYYDFDNIEEILSKTLNL